MSKKILIVGGGIIGICSAYYVSKSGHDVTIIDKYGMNSGASYVNAGYLSPGHIIPLAAPGVIKQGLKWINNGQKFLYFLVYLSDHHLKHLTLRKMFLLF